VKTLTEKILNVLVFCLRCKKISDVKIIYDIAPLAYLEIFSVNNPSMPTYIPVFLYYILRHFDGKFYEIFCLCQSATIIRRWDVYSTKLYYIVRILYNNDIFRVSNKITFIKLIVKYEFS